MLELLGVLQDFLKWQDITTDTAVSHLHNIYTTVLLIACSLVTTATEYVGSFIEYFSDTMDDPPKGLSTKLINTYCLMNSTFTMPDAFKRKVGMEAHHPGISNNFGDEDAKKYYSYYQWISYVLFFQAIMCYTSKFVWDAWEGGLLNKITMELNNVMYHEEEKCRMKKVLINYLLRYRKRHNILMFRYWFCDVLSLVNMVVQLYFMNKFFDNEFLSYGLQVIMFLVQAQEERVDPMVYIFPRFTKCTFLDYGPTCTIQIHDFLCLLPQNAVNEQTYILIWVWFIILLLMTFILVLWRALFICCSSVRAKLLQAHNHLIPIEVVKDIVRNLDVSDLWVLYMLGFKMDAFVYRDIIIKLAKKINNAAYNA